MVIRIPQVSTIIPTYNRSYFLIQAVRSVLQQTFDNFEIIIVDDGSNDNTREIIGELADPRIRYYYQDNTGLAAARNAGLQLAQGMYIAFLDDDDLWLPGKLAWQIQALNHNPHMGLVTGGYRMIGEQGKLLREVRPWQWRPELNLQTWLAGCPTVPSAVMVRRAWLDKVGFFDEELSRQACGAEDWDLWLRLAFAGCPMTWVKEILCAYRIHPNSMMHNAQRQRRSMLLVLDKLFARPDLPPEVHAQKNQVYSQAFLRGAARLISANQPEAARQDIAQAIQLNPELLDENGERLFGAFAGWIGDPLIEQPEEYVRCLFAHLPEQARVLLPRQREALGLAAKAIFFSAYRRQDWTTVRRNLVKIASYRPGLLLDRGVLSVTLELLVGRRWMQRLKKWLKRKPVNDTHVN